RSIIGVSGGRNSAPSLVSVGGEIAPHRWYHRGQQVTCHWCQWEE
ncbi:unnamed protein product, partial [Staurois parvus]